MSAKHMKGQKTKQFPPHQLKNQTVGIDEENATSRSDHDVSIDHHPPQRSDIFYRMHKMNSTTPTASPVVLQTNVPTSQIALQSNSLNPMVASLSSYTTNFNDSSLVALPTISSATAVAAASESTFFVGITIVLHIFCSMFGLYYVV
jgi:hypothetical protein